MKRLVGILTGVLTLTTGASYSLAQDSSAKIIQTSGSRSIFDLFGHGKQPCPCPAPQSTEPSPAEPPKTPPTEPGTPPQPQATAPTPPSDDLLAGENEAKSTQGTNTVVAAGKGLGSAVFDPNLTFSKTTVLTPLILPGMFTAATPQSAAPVDRIFFNFSYFGSVGVVSTPVFVPYNDLQSVNPHITQSKAIVAGFNLSTFNIGVEKTFLDGLGSVYVSVPLLYASDNITGQDINGLGDISAGFKIALYRAENGSVFSSGLTVTTPTGHAAVVNSFVPNSDGIGLVPSGSIRVNPTFLQPWIAALWIHDRFFIHDYCGAVLPMDNQISNFINNDLSAGYTIYQAQDRMLTSITPLVGAQLLLPLSNVGTPASGTTSQFNADVNVINQPSGNLISFPPASAPKAFSFPDQLIMTGGVQVGFWNRALFSVGVTVPVVGPNAYSVGATAGVNFLF